MAHIGIVRIVVGIGKGIHRWIPCHGATIADAPMAAV